ncbi:hypothetical protein GCM10022248_24880 [Nonomuraea soli]
MVVADVKGSQSRESKVVARAATVTTLLFIAGSASGFARDLLLANLFGAGAGTDAFMVAWSVPETAAPLLIEGALSFLLIPYFSRAVEAGQSLNHVVWAMLPKAAFALVLLTGVTAAAAPLITRAIAPGMQEHALASQSMQVISLTVLGFGLTGLCSAALRTQKIFGPAAAIYLVYNAAIIAAIAIGHDRWGIISAAYGVALGSLLMVLIQAPALLTHVGPPVRSRYHTAIPWMLFAPIAVYTLVRQAQVFVERFVGSSLPAGSISYLNYAQKIAQVPMVASLVLATISFPLLARSLAAGDHAAAARRVMADARVAATLVLLSTAFFVAHAPDVVGLLLEHGAFTAADTQATAWSLRLYCLGLMGQALVGVLCRVYFCGTRPAWYPALVMAAGLIVTGLAAPLLTAPLGVGGIALANAAGISLTALLLLRGMRGPIRVFPQAALLSTLARLSVAAAAAAGGAFLLRPVSATWPLAVAVPFEAVVTTALFAVGAVLTGCRRDLSLTLRRGGEES